MNPIALTLLALLASVPLASTGNNNARRERWARHRQEKSSEQLRELQRLEMAGEPGMAECQRWLELNLDYLDTAGPQPVRPGEQAMQERCERLISAPDATQQVPQEAPPTQVEPAMARTARGPPTSEPQPMASLADTVEQQPEQPPEQPEAGQSEAGAADEPAESDTLAELFNAIRMLVDREQTLEQPELELLAELGAMLERMLASAPVLPGRLRYLSGGLDAARTVLLGRSRWRVGALPASQLARLQSDGARVEAAPPEPQSEQANGGRVSSS